MTSPQRILAGAFTALLLASAATAWAGTAGNFSKTLDRRIAVPTGTAVSIENMAGAVHVTQGGPDLEVRATVVAGGRNQAAARALANTIGLDVQRDGKQLRIHVHYPVDAQDRYRYIPTRGTGRHDHGFSIFGMHFGSGSSSFTYQGRQVRVYQGTDEGVALHVDLAVRLPSGLHATIDNRVGSLQADHLQDELALLTASGDIDAHAVTGALRMHSGSGDMHIANLQGSLDVRTGSGDVMLQAIRGGVDVATGSGDIHGGSVHASRLELRTGSGDVKLDDLAGTLRIETGSGDIELHGIQSMTGAHIESGSGDIEIGGNLSAMTQFTIRSGSGDITLASTAPPPVHLDVRGSDIDVHWPGLRNVDARHRHFRADVGAATGEGRIRSGSGDITLR